MRLTALLVFVALADVTPHIQPRQALVLVTDKTWKGGITDGEVWLPPTFSDRNWPQAEEIEGPVDHGTHYGTENMFGFPSKAKWIWCGVGDKCSLRKAFDVRRGFRRAEMIISGDDLAEVRVNTVLVSNWISNRAIWGHRGGAEVIDLVPFLVDGRNVVTARVTNNGGPKGFVAEIRIDGDAFVLPYRTKTPPLAALEALDMIAESIDADPARKYDVRMRMLAERHGVGLIDRIRRLAAVGTDPRRAFMKSWLDRLQPDLGFPAGSDGRFGFGELTPETLRDQFQSEDANRVAMKLLVGARALGVRDEAALFTALRNAIEAGGNPRDRAVRFVGVLEITALAPDLAIVVKRDPKSTAGAYAAAALGRIGDRSHLDILRGALKCGNPSTERAAKRAIEQITGR